MHADAAFATCGNGNGDGNQFACFGIQCFGSGCLIQCAVGLQHFRMVFTQFAECFFYQGGMFRPVFKHDMSFLNVSG
nr:MAG TPA: hypothetical protein [Caudoviricetes sp.]